jgi:hypothetical protein
MEAQIIELKRKDMRRKNLLSLAIETGRMTRGEMYQFNGITKVDVDELISSGVLEKHPDNLSDDNVLLWRASEKGISITVDLACDECDGGYAVKEEGYRRWLECTECHHKTSLKDRGIDAYDYWHKKLKALPKPEVA